MIVRFLWVFSFGFFLTSGLVQANSEGAPYLDLDEPAEGYRGSIVENDANGTLVALSPELRARGPLCSYLIVNNKHHGEAPFEIMGGEGGAAKLRVRYPLDCEQRRTYKFDVAAVGCDGSSSKPVPVHVTVADVNEHAPKFERDAYVVSAEAGLARAELVRVTAVDADCDSPYGDVCRYEIATGNTDLFTIDSEGSIENLKPLSYENGHTHILTVVAYDCGDKRSEPVSVTIRVKKPCRPGWKDIAERVDYAAGSGVVALFPGARLEVCESDARCPGVARVHAVVTLQASRAGQGCDRNTYSIREQKAICGLDPNTVDLLPSPGPGNDWIEGLKLDSGTSEPLYEFDGAGASATVPPTKLGHPLPATFAISAWLRHAPSPDFDQHRKEHLLCLADDHNMNRHHYALFVRNCHLILLLRREFESGDLNVFRPAEWRWKIPEVCDNEWHHYAVNVRSLDAVLFVDGVRAARGPEVIEDWPLHPAHALNTTLVVGACWQGTEMDTKHHLRGWMAGLGVLVNGTHAEEALRCAAACREGLGIEPGSYQPAVHIEESDVGEVERLVRRVAYGDARAAPAPGRRNARLTATLTCSKGVSIQATPAETYIMVSAAPAPGVELSGGGELSRDYAAFRAGAPVFTDLRVRIVTPDRTDAGVHRLDSCVVSVYPALNPDHEALTMRDSPLLAHDIKATLTRDGVTLTGADDAAVYQQVLREIHYSNKKPAYYLNRVFKLTCSALDGRFVSNEYVQTLTVVHPRAAGGTTGARPSGLADKLDALLRDKQDSQTVHSPRMFAAHALRDAALADSPAVHVREHAHRAHDNNAALVMGVVCLGAVVAGAVGVVLRGRSASRAPPRAAHRPVPRHDNEMAWDDSALNITVNPMDEEAAEGARGGAEKEEPRDSASDLEDSCSDSDSDDEPVITGKGHKYRNISQLEWDNSTM